MEPKVDTLKFYHAKADYRDPSQPPVAFLSELSTPSPVEFHTMQIHHHFNLQLVGALESEWYRGRRSSSQVIAPGHASLNVASEPFHCRIAPTSNSVSLHVILPQHWMRWVQQQHEELFRIPIHRELQPILAIWRPELQHPARQIAEILQVDASPLRLRMEELLIELGLRLWQAEYPKSSRVAREKLTVPVLVRVLEYLHAHFSDDISLESLASVSGLSPFHLCRAFRVSVGISPWQYLKHVRLAEARLELLKTDIPVTDIGLRLGFSSPSHFSTAFRSAYGISPAGFRKTSR